MVFNQRSCWFRNCKLYAL